MTDFDMQAFAQENWPGPALRTVKPYCPSLACR